ncbi:MAG: isopenicillin N synthase family oxygenase [Flavobacteriales bacterium]|nr:isopenicillin N synthase family oxygenase [Flavobacteriales bacterium]
MNSALNIPLLDLNEFIGDDKTLKGNFVDKLGKAYEEIGFIALKNHGLTDEMVDKIYEQSRLFFSLPDNIKKKYEIEGLAGQRGYTSFGVEHSKGSKVGDLKEFWHFGQEVLDGDPIKSEYPENVHVDELPEFFTTGIQVYKALEETGKQVLRAIAIYLGLEELYFDNRIKNGNSILRPIHYGPILDHPKNAVRAGEHEDINLITLLMGASSDGLEILNKSGVWVAVTALPEHIVINVGDMLERLTNNKLRSTTHRVVNPPQDKWHEARYSIPFFLHPRSEVSLACLPQCIDADHPKLYDDKTAGEFLNERLEEIGLLKK